MSTTLLRRQLATARAARRETSEFGSSLQPNSESSNTLLPDSKTPRVTHLETRVGADRPIGPSSPQAAWQQILDAARYLPDGKVIIIGTLDAVLLHWWRQVSGKPNACPDGRNVPHKLYNRGVLRIEEFKRLQATYAKADKLDQRHLVEVVSQAICSFYLFEMGDVSQ